LQFLSFYLYAFIYAFLSISQTQKQPYLTLKCRS